MKKLKQTKIKLPKPAKAPKPTKAPKAEKPAKMNTAAKPMKAMKPSKVPKAPKAQKPEKTMKLSFPAVKSKKAEKIQSVEKVKASQKNIVIIATVCIAAALVIAAVVALIAHGVSTAKENGEKINYIMISSTPNKTIYYTKEKASYNGLKVVAIQNNGESYEVDISDCEITGFDSSSAVDNQTITVSYKGFVATFTIKIENRPKPTPILVGITLETLPKTEYKLGEWLETNGGVILREYKDGTTAKLNLVNSYIWGFENITGPGTYTLTVKYVENGILAETTYEITVTE